MSLTEPFELMLDKFSQRCIASAGRTFTYREAGTGEPMLFLHGISSSSGSWVNQFQHFGSRARCIAWDAPGYGGSSPEQSSTPSAKDYGVALDNFLNVLGVGQTLVVAHSLGALMAGALAAENPGRVRVNHQPGQFQTGLSFVEVKARRFQGALPRALS